MSGEFTYPQNGTIGVVDPRPNDSPTGEKGGKGGRVNCFFGDLHKWWAFFRSSPL